MGRGWGVGAENRKVGKSENRTTGKWLKIRFAFTEFPRRKSSKQIILDFGRKDFKFLNLKLYIFFLLEANLIRSGVSFKSKRQGLIKDSRIFSCFYFEFEFEILNFLNLKFIIYY